MDRELKPVQEIIAHALAIEADEAQRLRIQELNLLLHNYYS